MIPAEHKERIINDGIHFIRSITECYGPDEGMKLWEQIADVLDPSVKGDIFFAMLTGTHTTRIKISGIVSDRISVIKTIRNITGFGLKEAKDLSDLMQEGKSVSIECKPGQRTAAIKMLREVGVNV